MKYFLSALFAFSSSFVFSQEVSMTVTAQDKSIVVSPGDDNGDKILLIRKSVSAIGESNLSVKVSDEEIDDDWKRNFIIYDSNDNEISRLKSMRENSYCIALKDLLPHLNGDTEYNLYTIVLPGDPQKAMEVKVARELVCKIKVLTQ